MSKVWAWLVAAGLAVIGLLAYLLGRGAREAVVVEDPRPGVDAGLKASAAQAARDREAIDDQLDRDMAASAERAKKDAEALASDVARLHARFRRRVGPARR